MRGVFIDIVRTLLLLSFIAVAWWFMTTFITPIWDALFPVVASYTNSFAQSGVSTLNLFKTIWNNLPIFLAIGVLIWFYLRAQRREPDTYYVQ